MVLQDRVRQHCIGDGNRVGEARGFDNDPFEPGHLTPFALGKKAAQAVLQIAPNGATDAAVFHDQGIFGDALQQQVVQADFAEFVDQNGGIFLRRIAQQSLQQGGLAATQKTGDDVDRN